MVSKKKPIKHAVIIVNYNGWKDTVNCCQSIMKCKDRPVIFVVDNGSTDGSVEELRKLTGIELIESDINLGFSGGNNLGAKKAISRGAQVIYLLNNDTEVDSNLFYRSYRYVVHKNRIAGGKIYYAKGYEFHDKDKNKGNVLWYAGGSIDWQTGFATHDGVDQEDVGQYDKVCDVDFITGCFMAIPRQVWKKLGPLDERYFLYLEDAEYSLRALSRQVELRYNPGLIVYHRNSSSTVSGSALVDYYMTRNRFLMAHTYGTLRLKLALMREAIFRNWGSAVRRQAFMDYLQGRTGQRA